MTIINTSVKTIINTSEKKSSTPAKRPSSTPSRLEKTLRNTSTASLQVGKTPPVNTETAAINASCPVMNAADTSKRGKKRSRDQPPRDNKR